MSECDRGMQYGLDLAHIKDAQIGLPAMTLKQRVVIAAEPGIGARESVPGRDTVIVQLRVYRRTYVRALELNVFPVSRP